ncbi:MAG: FkbM family methyltransferase [Gammaproteobacteria bacterium]
MIRKLLLSITGFRAIQKILHYNVMVAQYLQGIGAGSSVAGSGERVVLDRLAMKHMTRYCVFDVGANKGQFASEVLSVLGAQSVDLHCFEPSPSTYHILVGTLQRYPAVHLNNEALGKEVGRAALYSDKVGSGLASLTRRRLDHFGITFSRTEDVMVNSVDTYCAMHGIEHIDLLKIDVEGHELDVLNGAQAMFKAGTIDTVTFEFGGCNIDTRTYFQDFFYFFSAQNMTIYRIAPSGYLMRIEKYSEMDEQFRTTNYVAVKQ